MPHSFSHYIFYNSILVCFSNCNFDLCFSHFYYFSDLTLISAFVILVLYIKLFAKATFFILVFLSITFSSNVFFLALFQFMTFFIYLFFLLVLVCYTNVHRSHPKCTNLEMLIGIDGK